MRNFSKQIIWVASYFCFIGCSSRLVENPESENVNSKIMKKISIEESLRSDTLLIENRRNLDKSEAVVEDAFDYEIFFLRAYREYTALNTDTINYALLNSAIYRTITPKGTRLVMPSLVQSRAYLKYFAEKQGKKLDEKVHRQVYLTILNGYRKYLRNEFNSSDTPFYTSDTPNNSPSATPTWDTEPGRTTGFGQLMVPDLVESVRVVSSETKTDKNLNYVLHFNVKNNTAKEISGLYLASQGSLNRNGSFIQTKPYGKFKISIKPDHTEKLIIPVPSDNINLVVAKIFFKNGTIKSILDI